MAVGRVGWILPISISRGVGAWHRPAANAAAECEAFILPMGFDFEGRLRWFPPASLLIFTFSYIFTRVDEYSQNLAVLCIIRIIV